jgi:hypothetical protein
MTADPRMPGSQGEDGPLAYGVSVFAGVLLATLAVFQILEGIAAIAEDDVFVSGINYVYQFDVTTWGWIHLVIGALALAVGVGILTGQSWALVAGMGLAVISALSQFMFMPFYPFWALLLIAMNILVIWALANQWQRT